MKRNLGQIMKNFYFKWTRYTNRIILMEFSTRKVKNAKMHEEKKEIRLIIYCHVNIVSVKHSHINHENAFLSQIYH